jgi:hypothetical protein
MGTREVLAMRTLGHFTNAYIAPPKRGADELLPKDVVPFGKYGAGRWTGHPVGAFIVGGIVLIALVGVPESRYLLAAALPLGALLGYGLWKLHEREPFALARKR